MCSQASQWGFPIPPPTREVVGIHRAIAVIELRRERENGGAICVKYFALLIVHSLPGKERFQYESQCFNNEHLHLLRQSSCG